MISHGDEIGRTQLGNNNVYCQDSAAVLDGLVAVPDQRRPARVRAHRDRAAPAHPAFRRRRFFEGKPIRTGDQVRDIAWLTTAGSEMTPEDWNSGFKCVAVFLNGEAIPSPNERGERVLDDSFLLCFNAHGKAVDLVTPDITYAQEWTAEFDTADPSGATPWWSRPAEGIPRVAIGACVAQDGLTMPDLGRCPPTGCRCAATLHFRRRRDVLDYLDDLGISHLYLSPILTAAEGSTHGYDVTDPDHRFGRLGGADGLARLSAAARDRGLGLIVDIVPNHVGVDLPQHNPWWWDVLARPRFTVRVLLRHRLGADLGSVDDVDHLRSTATCCASATSLPIAPGTGRHPAAGSRPSALPADRMAERICGYRRFFSITSLAGLRQEDPAVFDASHVEVRRWFTEGLVDGLRIDHPDGLSDPAGYLAWLREIVGPRRLDRRREDPRRRRGAGADAARRRHHRLRRAARDRRGVRRSRRVAALTALFESRASPTTTMPRWPASSRPMLSPTPCPANWPGCAGRSSPPRAPTTPTCPTRSAALISHIDVYRSDYLGAVPGAARRRWPKPRRRYRNWPQPLRDRFGGAGEQRRTGDAAAAAVRRRHRQVDGGLPVLPRRPTGVAQRGGRRTRPVRRQRRGVSPARGGPGPAVAARDDDADHPRHQARRGRARPHRRAVAGAVAVGRIRRRWVLDSAATRPCDRTLPVAEHFRRMAGRRSGDRRTAGAGCTRMPRRPSGRPPSTRRGTTPTPRSKRLCTRGWTPSWTDRSPTELTSLVARLDEHARNDAWARSWWR